MLSASAAADTAISSMSRLAAMPLTMVRRLFRACIEWGRWRDRLFSIKQTERSDSLASAAPRARPPPLAEPAML